LGDKWKRKTRKGWGKSQRVSDHINSIHLNIFTFVEEGAQGMWKGVKALEVSLAVLDIGLLSEAVKLCIQ